MSGEVDPLWNPVLKSDHAVFLVTALADIPNADTVCTDPVTDMITERYAEDPAGVIFLRKQSSTDTLSTHLSPLLKAQKV